MGGSQGATQAFRVGFQRRLDDRGLKLNPTECDYIPAQILSQATHPPEPPAGWKVSITSDSPCWALLRLLSPSHPDFCLRKLRDKSGSCGQTHDPTRPPPIPGHSSHPSSFQSRLVPDQPSCPHDAAPASTFVLNGCRLGGLIQVPITEGAWLQAQASIPVLHSPAAFLASSSSSHCNNLWSEYKDTHDPDVTAAETQFRLSVREDAAWRQDGAPHTQSHLSNLCDARTWESSMGRATQGDQVSLEQHQVP